jgi:hypothetical protein
MSNPIDKLHRSEDELTKLKKQVSTMKKVSIAAVALGVVSVIGVVFLLTASALPTFSIGFPSFPVSLSDLPKLPSLNTNNVQEERDTTIGSGLQDADTDKDGLSDKEEIMLGSDPLVSNTDGDRYVDGIDMDPTFYNVATIHATPYNLKVETKTDDSIVFEALSGERYMNPFTVLYNLQVDIDVKNIGTDYTSFVKYDVVFTLNGEVVKRIPETLSRLDAGQTIAKHYGDDIRLADLPKNVAEQVAEERKAQFSVDVQNIVFENSF